MAQYTLFEPPKKNGVAEKTPPLGRIRKFYMVFFSESFTEVFNGKSKDGTNKYVEKFKV